MKKIVIALLLCANVCVAQNLVPNPSFEIYSICPSNGEQIYYCSDWSGAGDSTNGLSTPDYFNTCSLNPNITPPQVSWGYQYPHSGNAFSNIIVFRENFLRREYVQARLSDSLLIGQVYYISFYASLAGASGYLIASNKVGALFTNYKFEYPDYAVPNNFAHVYTNHIITDTLNWYHFTGTFIADSNYKYITIGNFYDDLNTDTIDLGGLVSQHSSYFIDDVCVSMDSILCFGLTSFDIVDETVFSVYPNPAESYIRINGRCKKVFNILVYNMIGDKIYEELFCYDKLINCAHWPNGLYYISINNKRYKVIINH